MTKYRHTFLYTKESQQVKNHIILFKVRALITSRPLGLGNHWRTELPLERLHITRKWYSEIYSVKECFKDTLDTLDNNLNTIWVLTPHNSTQSNTFMCCRWRIFHSIFTKCLSLSCAQLAPFRICRQSLSYSLQIIAVK